MISKFRLQSFAIPGSIFLTILSGYLFTFPIALALVCLVSKFHVENELTIYILKCSAAGATVCYYLSFMFGRKLLMQYFPDRLAQWQIEVSTNLILHQIYECLGAKTRRAPIELHHLPSHNSYFAQLVS